MIHKRLFAALESDPAATVRVDLESRQLTLPDGSNTQFSIDEFARQCMLQGVDELGYILAQSDAIASYEAARPLTRKHTRTGLKWPKNGDFACYRVASVVALELSSGTV